MLLEPKICSFTSIEIRIYFPYDSSSMRLPFDSLHWFVVDLSSGLSVFHCNLSQTHSLVSECDDDQEFIFALLLNE